MDYKKAWEELRSSLLSRGEYFFFAKGDDPSSPYANAQTAVHYTLETMNELEKKIKNPPEADNVVKISEES